MERASALLVQESLAKIGIKITIDRIPGANWRTLRLGPEEVSDDHRRVRRLARYAGLLLLLDLSEGHLFNAANYDNPELAGLVQKTSNMAQSDPDYAPSIRRMIAIAIDEVPRIPLWQPALSSAMGTNVSGYESWFHRGVDARPWP